MSAKKMKEIADAATKTNLEDIGWIMLFIEQAAKKGKHSYSCCFIGDVKAITEDLTSKGFEVEHEPLGVDSVYLTITWI